MPQHPDRRAPRPKPSALRIIPGANPDPRLIRLLTQALAAPGPALSLVASHGRILDPILAGTAAPPVASRRRSPRKEKRDAPSA